MTPGSSGASGAAPSTYRLPLAGPTVVLVPFGAPVDPYGAGHRGVDLSGSIGEPVLAAATGTVVVSQLVAGRLVVVIAHPDGLRTEYEPLLAGVPAGTRVTGGEVIGRLAGGHPACAPHVCLHWGARRGDVYVDPLGLLRTLGVVRLLPA